MAEKGTVRYLDTNKFSYAIEAFKKGIEEYNSIRDGVKDTTNTLFERWQGEGKKQFEKDYETIYRQLTDIADIMYELRDTMLEAQTTYMETDEELGKRTSAQGSSSKQNRSQSTEARHSENQTAGSQSTETRDSGNQTSGGQSAGIRGSENQDSGSQRSGSQSGSNTGGSQGSIDYAKQSVGRRAGNLNSAYYTNDNISYTAGYGGQCTWYAYGRFYEVTGIKLRTAPNANRWLTANANDSRLNITYGLDNFRYPSIAVCETDKYSPVGHVLFLEGVDYNTDGSVASVYISEANSWYANQVGGDGVVQKISYNEYKRRYQVTGYITAAP